MDINKKISNIINLSAQERYDYFIRKIADFEEVWGLYDGDGWAMTMDDGGRKAMPFWPEKEFAKLCAQNEWENYKPKAIGLDDFIEKWLVGMYKDNLKAVVFYTPNNKGLIIYPHKLKDDLEEELEQYE
ncbi:DUF2750 domain-containing protein [Galbibacter sp. BG1]|uniref:DUF2750 domain-containing protein n=1 Tax=Galbibacter sp. BG1 TaxID=1170699 RepID=UPI002105C407|nr:DUF2750 domain-containing protein [Galbibacter sp. BG1]